MIQSHIHWHHREELNQDLTFQTVPFNSIPLEMGFELHISVLRLRLRLGLPFRVLFPSHQHSWIASWRAWAFVAFLSYSISANSAASESRAPSWHWVMSSHWLSFHVQLELECTSLWWQSRCPSQWSGHEVTLANLNDAANRLKAGEYPSHWQVDAFPLRRTFARLARAPARQSARPQDLGSSDPVTVYQVRRGSSRPLTISRLGHHYSDTLDPGPSESRVRVRRVAAAAQWLCSCAQADQ